MRFPAVEKYRHMCSRFRNVKSFSQLNYISTCNTIISCAYAVRRIDDDTDVKMFLARFWWRRLRWTFKEAIYSQI